VFLFWRFLVHAAAAAAAAAAPQKVEIQRHQSRNPQSFPYWFLRLVTGMFIL